MDSNKLVLSILMSFSLLTLSACKEGGAKSRTSIKKGTATNQNKTTRLDKSAQQPASSEGSAAGADRKQPTPPAPQALDVNGNSAHGVTIGGQDLLDKGTCANLDAQAKTLGWKINSLSVPEDKSIDKKLKITFYTLKESDSGMNNPVIYFNRSAFQNMTERDLKKFKDISSEYSLDPILMDMRGAGCSSALPDIKTRTTELNKYGSRYAVQDAEQIRKVLLKDKPWKILADRSGGVVALRYAQIAPEGISSLHVADFAPVKNQTELMKLRIAQETEVWKSIAKQENVTDEILQKALKNLDAAKCDKLKSCQDLIDLEGGVKMSYKNQWPSIANDIKALADGTQKASEKTRDLMKIYESKKKHRDLKTATRILDLDTTKNLSACSEALKTDSKGVINSCRLELSLGHGEIAAVKNVLNHDALNMTTIRENLLKNSITYNLFAGARSTLYPKDAYEEHEKEMGEALEDTLQFIDAGSEVFESPEFLKTLR